MLPNNLLNDPPKVNGIKRIEYFEGDRDSHLMLTVPHGGDLGRQDSDRRTGMPVRTNKRTKKGVEAQTLADSYTIELAKQLQKDLKKRLGKKPHLIVLNVARKRLDANREIEEACFGNAACKIVYEEYHDKIRVAIQ